MCGAWFGPTEANTRRSIRRLSMRLESGHAVVACAQRHAHAYVMLHAAPHSPHGSRVRCHAGHGGVGPNRRNNTSCIARPLSTHPMARVDQVWCACAYSGGFGVQTDRPVRRFQPCVCGACGQTGGSFDTCFMFALCQRFSGTLDHLYVYQGKLGQRWSEPVCMWMGFGRFRIRLDLIFAAVAASAARSRIPSNGRGATQRGRRTQGKYIEFESEGRDKLCLICGHT